jgi:hypothetical protein
MFQFFLNQGYVPATIPNTTATIFKEGKALQMVGNLPK